MQDTEKFKNEKKSHRNLGNKEFNKSNKNSVEGLSHRPDQREGRLCEVKNSLLKIPFEQNTRKNELIEDI